jgi:hypothetical protein
MWPTAPHAEDTGRESGSTSSDVGNPYKEKIDGPFSVK